MSFFKRISQYNFSSLVRIAFYKTLKKAVVITEKCLPKKDYCEGETAIEFSETQNEFIKKFWQDLPLSPVSSTIAQELLNGMVTNFEYTYPFESYLKDPITQKLWPVNEFFEEARTKIDGYGDVKYVLELNKLNHLVEAAKAYHLGGEEQYIRYISEQLAIWKNEVPYERSVANRIIMDIAFRSINLIFISLLCLENKFFKKRVYPAIHNILVLSERQMRLFSTPRWFKTGNGANHVIGEMVGLIITQRWLAFVENKELRKTLINQEYKWLNDTLDKLIAPSGVYLENSANYTRVVSEFLVCLQLFESAFAQKNSGLEEQYLILILGYLNDLQCNGTLPNFGDNDAATILIPFKRDFADIKPLLAYYSKNHSDQKVALQKYRADGQLIWNSEDKNRLHLFMRFGKWSIFKPGCATHNHADLMSVVLFANEEPVIVDKGCLYYNQSEKIKHKALSVASHNTVFVEGHEQAHYASAWFDFPKSEYKDAKDPQIIEAKMTTKEGFSHTRSISYNHGELLINDIVESPFENEIIKMQYLLHESITPQIISDSSIKLKLPTGKYIVINFDGITDLQICQDFYFPHYGIKKETYSIRCSVVNNQAVTCIIVSGSL